MKDCSLIPFSLSRCFLLPMLSKKENKSVLIEAKTALDDKIQKKEKRVFQAFDWNSFL